VLAQIVHACPEYLEPQDGVDGVKLQRKIDERLENQSSKFVLWAQDSHDRLVNARDEASRHEFTGWAIAGALAMYLVLAVSLPGRAAGLDAEIIGVLVTALVCWLAWRLWLVARDKRRIRDAREHWEKVLKATIALPLIAQEMNALLTPDISYTMDMAVATMTGNGRDPEVPVVSAAMENVAETARTIGSGSIGISGPRGAGKSTILNKFDTRDAAWKPEQDIRVTVAAPVDYDAREFIIHLFKELCERVDAKAPEHSIGQQARRHIEDLRFQRTYSSSLGSTFTPTSSLGFAWSRGRERAEQPLGLPALVDRFRIFSKEVAEWNWDRKQDTDQQQDKDQNQDRDGSRVSTKAQGNGQVQRPVQEPPQEGAGRVIICIDEMDKIRDSGRAEQFLNNIKAIFDVPGCLYLVAISEDAMTVFASQTPAIRTAFDSAFDEIISVPPMNFADALKLLQLRTTKVPRPFLALCHVLAGGVPRELVRAVRALMYEAKLATEEGYRAAASEASPVRKKPVKLDEVREKLIRARCEVMRREAILQLGRSGAGGDILAPLHQRHWPGDAHGCLTSDALEEAADALEEEAKKLDDDAKEPGNTQLATMCRDVAVALSFYAVVTQLFDGTGRRVHQALKSKSDPLVDDLAVARHAMRTNSQLAAKLLAGIKDRLDGTEVPSSPVSSSSVPGSPEVNSGTR
jgi:hypothetical protein